MAAEDGGATRKTFNLTPKGKRALDDLLDAEFGSNDTDVANRALALAAYLMGEVKAGAKIQIAREGEPPLNVVFL